MFLKPEDEILTQLKANLTLSVLAAKAKGGNTVSVA